MTYRNVPRRMLGALSVILFVIAIITYLVIRTQTANLYGDTGEAGAFDPIVIYAIVAALCLAGVITGTGWLVLRGINYDTWYRQAHPGKPLHELSTDDVSSPADWQAADRTPGF